MVETFDIAISYAEEDRPVAVKLSALLSKKYNLKVYFDDYYQAESIGKNLLEYLIDIYKNKSRYCAVLVSKYYINKRFTRHEWRAAQERAFENIDIVYIIPIQIDNSVLPGLLDSIKYLSSQKLTIPKIASNIFSMVNSEIEKLNTIRTANDFYRNGDFDSALKVVSHKSFDNEIEALRIRASVYGNSRRENKAIVTLKKILLFLPNDFLCHFLLGIFYYRTGEFEASLFHSKLAKKISPKHPTIIDTIAAAKKKLRNKIMSTKKIIKLKK